MKKILCIIFVVLFASLAVAQNVDFTKENFADNKKGLAAAQKAIKNGDKAAEIGDFRSAYESYLEAQQINPNNAELNFKIFKCCYNLKREAEGFDYLNKAYELNKAIDPEIDYFKGMERQYNYDFAGATTFFKKVAASSPWKKDAEKHIRECEFGTQAVRHEVRCFIDNVGDSVNSEYDDYNPVITADGGTIYFTSRRNYKKAEYSGDGNFFENIYTAKQKQEDVWTGANMVDGINNLDDHDAVMGVSVDGHKMLIYRANNGGDLYEAVKKGSKFQKPKAIKAINTKYHETSASYSYDGKTIYFCSDREGGFGEHDIYRSTLNAKGEWGAPENLGSVINTPYDEKSVFAHPDGKTLYFCSDGHPGLGGYDIFATTFENGHWTTPVNIGYPVNTTGNDAFLVLTADKRSGYYSSKQAGSRGYDIYKITFLGPEKEFAYRSDNDLLSAGKSFVDVDIKREKIALEEARLTLLRGIVIDAATREPIVSANIDLYDIAANQLLLSFETDGEGRFLLSLPSGRNYAENINAPGYLFHSENFDLPDTAAYQIVEQTIELKKIEVGKSIVLNNIFFDFDKATLKPESLTELEKVYDLMSENPKIVVELSGHTDSRGSDAYNKDLSQRRAQAVVDYLVKKGIKADRLIAKGYGEERPIDTNDTDEGRAHNRRTEFTIIK